MDPRKIAIVAAVAVTAGLAGCSAGHRGRAASAAQVSSTLSPAVAPASPTTAPTSTTSTTSTSTTTTVPATTTTQAAASAVTASPTTKAIPVTTTAPCPSNLASQLASTGSARQLVTVEAVGWRATTATVELWQRSGGCWTAVAGPWSGYIGENGFTDASRKREGDGTTPTGVYGLGPVMYGNAANPGTKEPYHLLQCGDWWDEDPNSPEYNTFQAVGCNGNQPRQTFGGGSEQLWLESKPYPSFAVIDYNTRPVVPYAGSGIFLHASTGGPTVGCVSVPLSDLDLTLRWLDPSQAPAFVMGPANEITQF